MSGFGTVVGFMFSFFIMAGLVSFSFIATTNDFKERAEILEFAKQDIIDLDSSFEIDYSYVDGNRIRVLVSNSGKSDIVLKDDGVYCFDVYVNGNYISRDDFNFFQLNPASDYFVLLDGDNAILDIDYTINESVDNEVVIISCSGIKVSYDIYSSQSDWYDDLYKRRGTFSVFNGLGSNTAQTYFDVELNSSNFDFSKATEDTIFILLSYFENSVLDLNFDDYTQQVEDFSRYSNTVYLGNGVAVASDDPVSSDGVFFGALSFDGSNDFVRVLSDSSLQIDKEITISSWVKWDGVGGNFQTIFLNGLLANNLTIVNDGGVNDGKVQFGLNVGGVPTLIYSSSVLDNSWHHVLGVYNGSFMSLYIDGELSSQTSISGDISTSLSDNYIGSSGGANFLSGDVDDFKLFNFALNETDIDELYLDSLRYKQLNFTVGNWSAVDNYANISVKIPYIRNGETVEFDIYYYKYGDSFDGNGSGGGGGAGPSAPSAISDLSEVLGNSQVYLSWTAPSDGGDAITSYTVEYGTVSSGLFNYTYVDDANPNATISGLTNNVEWQFRVYATNGVGDGPDSNVVNSTPTGRFYMTGDGATDFGFDGTANRAGGFSIPSYAQLLYGTASPDASKCFNPRAVKTNYQMTYDYTSIFSSQTEFKKNSSALIIVDSASGSSPLTVDVRMYEYNDSTGVVGGLLGFASNVSNVETGGTGAPLGFIFNNTAFNISSGNRIRVDVQFTNAGGNTRDYLCYGTGTQSYFDFDVN